MKTDPTLPPEEKDADKLEASGGRVPRLVGLAIAVPPSLGDPSESVEYINCGSGQDYGICKACGRGHGQVIFRRANAKGMARGAHGQPLK